MKGTKNVNIWPILSLKCQFSSLDYLIDTIFGVEMIILPTKKQARENLKAFHILVATYFKGMVQFSTKEIHNFCLVSYQPLNTGM